MYRPRFENAEPLCRMARLVAHHPGRYRVPEPAAGGRAPAGRREARVRPIDTEWEIQQMEAARRHAHAERRARLGPPPRRRWVSIRWPGAVLARLAARRVGGGRP